MLLIYILLKGFVYLEVPFLLYPISLFHFNNITSKNILSKEPRHFYKEYLICGCKSFSYSFKNTSIQNVI